MPFAFCGNPTTIDKNAVCISFSWLVHEVANPWCCLRTGGCRFEIMEIRFEIMEIRGKWVPVTSRRGVSGGILRGNIGVAVDVGGSGGVLAVTLGKRGGGSGILERGGGRRSCALRCNLQFAAILPQLTMTPSLLRFLDLYVKLQRGSDAVEGGLMWLENRWIF